jgi:hypothetical protein
MTGIPDWLLVAVASSHQPSIPMESSNGGVSYKFVGRVDALSLKDPAKLQEFAGILVSTLAWTDTP